MSAAEVLNPPPPLFAPGLDAKLYALAGRIRNTPQGDAISNPNLAHASARALAFRYLTAYFYLRGRQRRERHRENEIPTTVQFASQVCLLRDGDHGVEMFLSHRIAGGFQDRWCIQGGPPEQEGERPRAVAVRELEEEAGVSVPEDQLLPFYRYVAQMLRVDKVPPVNREYRIHSYLVRADNLNPFNASPREHDAVKWEGISRALALHRQAERHSARFPREQTDGLLTPGVLRMMRWLQGYRTVDEVIQSLPAYEAIAPE